uniref:Uncharacterized protein n=1 Tax=Serratia marcescens TaxID=615 RepID=A0A1C3HKR5_SERMA|nr:Uncharacterised protein [Serratia marcescens]
MFTFELNQPVEVIISGEKGYIKARAEYTTSSDSYLIHGIDTQGKSFKKWFEEEDLRPSEQ